MQAEIWNAITAIGDLRFWILFMMALAVYVVINRLRLTRREKRTILIMFLTLVFVSLAVQGLKLVLQTPRICVPCTDGLLAGCNIYCPTEDYAFPSGHAALAFGMFTAGWLTLPSSRKQRLWSGIALIVPFLVGASRLALGVHTLDQVAAGAITGLTAASIVWILLRKRKID